jgi:hypothetical protein
MSHSMRQRFLHLHYHSKGSLGIPSRLGDTICGASYYLEDLIHIALTYAGRRAGDLSGESFSKSRDIEALGRLIFRLAL